jgi:cytochrome P450
MHDRGEVSGSAGKTQGAWPYSSEAPDFDTSSELHVANPYGFYRKLREHHPVFASQHLNAVVLSRMQDVRDGFRDHTRLPSKGSLEGAVRLDPQVSELLIENDATLDNFIANVDPPQHTRLRRAVARLFSVSLPVEWDL